MDGSLERRINVAKYWASSKIALLDSFERYEDSYALTQEFREWITSPEDNPEHLSLSVLRYPQSFIDSISQEKSDKDELLEL